MKPLVRCALSVATVPNYIFETGDVVKAEDITAIANMNGAAMWPH
jgi:hypothetical protein